MLTLPIILGLLTAITWGAADFNGGLATKRSNPYGVVMVAHIISLAILVPITLLFDEPLPLLQEWLWSIAAGFMGSIGLLFLYRALAEGQMSIVAPVTAVIAATISILFGVFIDGTPNHQMLLGFSLAIIAVWLISGDGQRMGKRDDLRLPVIAGLSFGLFYLCLERASQSSLLWPMVSMRVVSSSSFFIFVTITRQSWKPARASLLPIFLSSILDTLGNTFYALSALYGRLDVAAVLGSLYPGATVLLAWVFLKERISRVQTIGILIALSAIIMLTL